MITFPNCKINLGLNIIAKRADGFHDIETLFLPLQLHDALECIVSEKNNFQTYGIDIPGNASDNIILKAYELLKRDFPSLPQLSVYLLKHIPTGAGLGGGSADGAFMLRMLNDNFDLNISNSKLSEYALKLGSDCPFFINNSPCFASGRGETLRPIELNLQKYHIVLVKPDIHINTGWAFSQIKPHTPIHTISEIINTDISNWQKNLTNDFEAPIFKAKPILSEIKCKLLELNAVYTAMSGTGSVVYGLFDSSKVDESNLQIALFELFKTEKYWITKQLLKS
jgi:4-diphosphocytidyl-2-C-methyl-D-erythritol kinase